MLAADAVDLPALCSSYGYAGHINRFALSTHGMPDHEKDADLGRCENYVPALGEEGCRQPERGGTRRSWRLI